MSKENTALFEVYRGKEGLMQTNDVACIYDKSTLSAMVKDGHRLKLNGATATPAQIAQYVKDNKSKKSK